MRWQVIVTEDNGNENERSGIANNPEDMTEQVESALTQIIDDIEEGENDEEGGEEEE